MKLNIENFAKIKNAEIIVDGITVIAGDNNTGKSTVGKIIFSLFNSIAGISEKIYQQRMKEIYDNIISILRNELFNNYPRATVIRYSNVITKDIVDEISTLLSNRTSININRIHEVVINNIKKQNKKILLKNEIIDNIVNILFDIINLSEETVRIEVINRYFNDVFNKQINSLTNIEKEANLNLTIKNNNIYLSFFKNQCNVFKSDISLINKAIYIENPFTVDQLDYFYDDVDFVQQSLKKLLMDSSNDLMDGIFENVLAKEKLNEVYKTLKLVIDGNIVENSVGQLSYVKEGFVEPISLSNLSTGLKSFAIIKMLIENNSIKEKDVLILDEPEIHLHPQWQIRYAELIVLLQKAFNLSVIVTTHSPYFLDAINLFSIKHNQKDKVNYYLSSMINNAVTIDCVNDKLDLIYQKMASPIGILDTLRDELNND